MPRLLAVPNFSEGGDVERLGRLEQALAGGTTLLDRHSDADHARSVFTLAGAPGALTEALSVAAEEALETIDMRDYRGAHPAIGALDVCPIVWFQAVDRDAARTEAVAVASQIGGLGVPVFLYGELAREPGRAERAYFRNGGLAELWLRMESGELRPDFGPDLPHRTAGATSRSPARWRRACAKPVAARSGCGRSASCSPAAAPRSRPTSTIRWRRRWARSSNGCVSWRRRWGRGRSRRSWSAWSRRGRSSITPPTCRCGASTPAGT
jgi:hypothetical protein